MTDSVFGAEQTRYFFDLGPMEIIEAVESAGHRCTGRSFPLNSYENRVYEVEIEVDNPATRYDERKIIKFYRPARWTESQIRDEHEFIAELKEDEIPAIGPEVFADGDTLHKTASGDLWFTIYPKIGGRSTPEMSDMQLEWIGRLVARLHSVGARRSDVSRLALNTDTYGRANLEFLLSHDWVPRHYRDRYETVVNEICSLGERLLSPLESIRLHGDCHHGNLLWDESGPFFLDFDDMVTGPPVQDIWLLLTGRDAEARRQLNVLLDGYEQIRPFDRTSIRSIELLRSLRLIHFTAWIARRWQDPAFPRIFPHFNSEKYWHEQTHDLEEQLPLVRDSLEGGWEFGQDH
jgi:Ser/Thr protein kinase RdoA (MazF antagonist)